MAWVCQGFGGTIQWVSPTDQSDPLLNISCVKVKSEDGPLPRWQQGVFFKVLRKFVDAIPPIE